MAAVLCPDCGQKIVIGPKPKKGQYVTCPHCNTELEIVSISPLELDWAPFDGEDDPFDDDDIWGDDDEDLDDWDDDDEDLEDWDDEDDEADDF
jgi:lysine biosynthesis protein LysW